MNEKEQAAAMALGFWMQTAIVDSLSDGCEPLAPQVAEELTKLWHDISESRNTTTPESPEPHAWATRLIAALAENDALSKCG